MSVCAGSSGPSSSERTDPTPADGPSSGPARSAPYNDGAPPGHTGGFGEPTCARCHFDAGPGESAEPGEERAGTGEDRTGLVVTGLPERWLPGGEYPVVVRLRQSGMRRAGFQLAARFDDGRQAGDWRVDEKTVRVVTPDSSRVHYAGHAVPARPGADDAVAWRLTWIAPTGRGPTVHLHVAANAANGDDSEFGDAIHVDSLESAPSKRGATEDRGAPRMRDVTEEAR